MTRALRWLKMRLPTLLPRATGASQTKRRETPRLTRPWRCLTIAEGYARRPSLQ
jgi:hypothetical protein